MVAWTWVSFLYCHNDSLRADDSRCHCRAEEAGAYIERYKAFEHKAPDLIKERVDDDYMSRLNSALTNIKGVNKTDVVTLATNFGVSGHLEGGGKEAIN